MVFELKTLEPQADVLPNVPPLLVKSEEIPLLLFFPKTLSWGFLVMFSTGIYTGIGIVCQV